MKTDNELIEYFWVSQGGNPHMAADLSFYESSWDMLMPVVEKIDKLYNDNFPVDFIDRVLAKENDIIDNHYMDVVSLPLATTITEAYVNIVKFIKWYKPNEE